jgi:type I restriction enzyme S subunit
MPGEMYEQLRLGNIADFRNGKAISPDRYSPTGEYPVFGANGQIARSNGVLNPDPVIVIGRVGAYCGSVYYVPEPSWVTDNAIVAIPKKGNDLRFLYYLLGSLDLRRTAIGSAQPLITQGGLRVVDTLVPPLKVQQAIGCILGALDDKIELNRRMNQTLEAMARAMFKSWFVDFDPVRAKAEGQQPSGLRPDRAALFPDSFEDSELGRIPAGWEVWSASDAGQVVCGKTPSTRVPEYYGDDVPFVTIPDMHHNVFATTTHKKLSRSGAASQARKTLPRGTICVSCIATPGLVVITTEESQTNQQINSVVLREQNQTYYWFWAFRDLGDDIRAGGSGGSVLANLSTGRFSALRVLAATADLRRSYHSRVAALFERILTNLRESEVLTALRDTLLPKLISGELRVPDAERIIGRCVQ